MEALAYEQFARLERDHWWFRARRRVYLGLIEQALGGARPARALDLGAGCGGFAAELARLAGRVVALDSDAGCARACGARADAAALLGRGESLPLADGTFELACLFDVLEHVDDERGALREVERVLAPGGLVFVSVPAYPWLWSRNDALAGHRRRYTRSSLTRALAGAGFELVRCTHVNVALFPAIATAVGASKLALALGARAAPRTNLSWRLPRGVEALCFHAFAAEARWLRAVDAPFGHSIAALARRARAV